MAKYKKNKVAIFAETSQNRKIAGKGKVSATYASIQGSCPNTCSLKGGGCYAQMGMTAIHTRRLDKALTPGMRPEAIARKERQTIRESFKGRRIPQDGVRGGRDLRLHVSGDARTKASAAILGTAADEWAARDGGDVWTYTHAWKTVPRKHWGKNVSVLASTEDPKDTKAIRKQGYAPAIVVHTHPSEKVFTLAGSSTKWIPCPQQTREVPCTDCRLCFDADRMHASDMGIAFAAHGAVNKIKKHLKVI